MMSLPTVLYRCPGPHSRPGGTYAYLGVESPEAYDKAIADGWQLTMPAAIADYEGIKAAVIAEVDAEMKVEAKAAPVEVVKPRGKPGPKPKQPYDHQI